MKQVNIKDRWYEARRGERRLAPTFVVVAALFLDEIGDAVPVGRPGHRPLGVDPFQIDPRHRVVGRQIRKPGGRLGKSAAPVILERGGEPGRAPDLLVGGGVASRGDFGQAVRPRPASSLAVADARVVQRCYAARSSLRTSSIHHDLAPRPRPPPSPTRLNGAQKMGCA